MRMGRSSCQADSIEQHRAHLPVKRRDATVRKDDVNAVPEHPNAVEAALKITEWAQMRHGNHALWSAASRTLR